MLVYWSINARAYTDIAGSGVSSFFIMRFPSVALFLLTLYNLAKQIAVIKFKSSGLTVC